MTLLGRFRTRATRAASTRALLATIRRCLVTGLPEPQVVLAVGSAYWVSVEHPEDAEWLLRQILEIQSPGVRLGLVSCGPRVPVADLARVRYFELDASRLDAALPQLPAELTRAGLDRAGLLVLSMPDSAWGAYDPAQFAQWCARLVDWVAHHEAALVIVSRGTASWAARVAASTFAGVARLYRDGASRRYRIESWRAHGVACADQDYVVNAADAFVRVLPAVDTVASSAGLAVAGGPVLVERNALDDARALPANWHVFDTRADLFENVRTLTLATVVLGLHDAAAIEPLARALHALRRHGAEHLTVVLRERVPDVTEPDRQLLRACGVRVVVGFATPLAAFWELLRGLRSPAVATADTRFEVLRARLLPPPTTGVVTPSVFTSTLAMLYARAAEVPQHRLLRLAPRGGLGTARCLEQMEFGRPGEFACVAGGVIWLFLFGCDDETVDPTLARICRLPADVVFSRRDAFAVRDGIPQELTAAGAGDATPPLAPASAPSGPVPMAAPPAPLRLRPILLGGGERSHG